VGDLVIGRLIGDGSIVVIGFGMALDGIAAAGGRASAILLFVLVGGGVCLPLA
jgi:hypothetical protein